jgi:hypothetical protein
MCWSGLPQPGEADGDVEEAVAGVVDGVHAGRERRLLAVWPPAARLVGLPVRAVLPRWPPACGAGSLSCGLSAPCVGTKPRPRLRIPPTCPVAACGCLRVSHECDRFFVAAVGAFRWPSRARYRAAARLRRPFPVRHGAWFVPAARVRWRLDPGRARFGLLARAGRFAGSPRWLPPPRPPCRAARPSTAACCCAGPRLPPPLSQGVSHVGVVPFPAQRVQRHDVLGGLIHEYSDAA